MTNLNSNYWKLKEINEYKRDIKNHDSIGAFSISKGLKDYIFNKYNVKL
jgi:hypothetical protein